MNVRRFDDIRQDVVVIDEADDLISNRTSSLLKVMDSIRKSNEK